MNVSEGGLRRLCLGAGLLIAGSSIAIGDDNGVDVVESGELEQSERQAILGINSVGLEETSYRFPVRYCPHERDCRDGGAWSVSLPQGLADAVLADNMPAIIPARYDRLMLSADGTRIETATDVTEIDDAWVDAYQFPAGGDLEAFTTHLQGYLNDQIADPLAELMAASRQARYDEMPREEQTRFIEERAREAGIPADVLEGLLSSAYTFAYHIPPIRGGRFTIQQIQRERADGTTYYVYRTSLSAPVHTRLAVFAFDGEQFEVYNVIDTEPGNFMEAWAQQISGSASVTTRSRPRRSDAQAIFQRAYAASFGDTVTALNVRLKDDDAFTVAAPALSADNGAVEMTVGNQENLRPGAVVRVTRVIDGEREDMGWGRVRDVGDSCLALPEDERTTTRADLVVDAGADAYDQVREIPYTGVFGRFGVGQETSTLTNGEDTDAGEPTYLDLGFVADFAFLRNNASLHGMWTSVDIGIGVLGDGTFQGDEVEGGMAFRLRTGIEYRRHLLGAFYGSVGADFGVEGQRYELREEDLTATSLFVNPRIGAGYHFGPKWQIQASVGYHQPVSENVDYDGTGDHPDVFEGGANAMLSIGYHVDFAGPFANSTAMPSERCQEIRDNGGQDPASAGAGSQDFSGALACAQASR
ncbi:hypothetical protein ACNSTU_06860 [Aquisalimonas sp. APHAB1-3]|uniref:hypothetical protein n=3 Tax=unclassified Aquisalimonas TaxID=2644645 RepID=UPI003AB0016C